MANGSDAQHQRAVTDAVLADAGRFREMTREAPDVAASWVVLTAARAICSELRALAMTIEYAARVE